MPGLFRYFIVIALCLLAGACTVKPIQHHLQTRFVFASVAQGQSILTSQDEFLTRLSPADRSARLQTQEIVSEEQYLSFVKEQVMSWRASEVKVLRSHLHAIRNALSRYAVTMPDKVMFIKTTGLEEGDVAYTRGNAIVLTDRHFSFSERELRILLFHEFFHIVTRSMPQLKHKLYRHIGFYQANELIFPKALQHRKITNPDAPINNSFIVVNYEGERLSTVPVLLLPEQGYDKTKGGPFFTHLQFSLMVVEHDKQSDSLTPMKREGEVRLLNPAMVNSYFEQIGHNTDYVIHPEEILAYNFAYLMIGIQGKPNPEILAAIHSELSRL